MSERSSGSGYNSSRFYGKLWRQTGRRLFATTSANKSLAEKSRARNATVEGLSWDFLGTLFVETIKCRKFHFPRNKNVISPPVGKHHHVGNTTSPEFNLDRNWISRERLLLIILCRFVFNFSVCASLEMFRLLSPTEYFSLSNRRTNKSFAGKEKQIAFKYLNANISSFLGSFGCFRLKKILY